MQRYGVLSVALLLALIAAVAHALALDYFLYWRYPYFDVIPHSAMGAMAGIILYLVARYRLPPRDAWWLAVLGTLAVGIAWEFFEYAVGLTKNEPGFLFDTAKDLVMDSVGGLAGSSFAHKNNL